MFSKAKPNKAKDKDARAKEAAAFVNELDARQPAQSAAAKKTGSIKPAAAPKATVPSIISQDVVIKGAMRASGEVQLDGVLEGDIEAAALIVGEKAVVRGEIVCEKITVRGRVEGGIRARQVNLANTAYIDGDILHSSLSVETGAYFEGNCRHYDDPLSEAAAKEFAKANGASTSASFNGAANGAGQFDKSDADGAKPNAAADKPGGAPFSSKATLR